MKPLPGILCSMLLVGAIIVPQGPVTAGETDSDREQSLLEIARAAGSFKTLLKALEVTDLESALEGAGPFTIFAPTDAAFARLAPGTLDSLLLPENRARLVQILKFHVVSGEQDSGEALRSESLTTLEGGSLRVRLEQGRLQVNQTPVTANDLRATNGTIHIIDGVLIPAAPSIPEVDPNSAAIGILSLAIERGVPLFNDGQELACASLYELAVRSLLDRPCDLSASVLAALGESLAKASRDRDATGAAWTLRAGMDRAIQLLSLQQSLKESSMIPTTSRRVFDFKTEEEVASWFTVNDDVMGGISRARMVPAGKGVAQFEGALSLENNGGFATIRSRARDLKLAGADGLRFRVRGDGRTYRVSALTGDRRSQTRIWKQDFATTKGEWQEIFVPFDSMVLSIMGRRLPSAGPVSPDRIRSISFGIADKDETPFALEIDWIDAVGPVELTGRP